MLGAEPFFVAVILQVMVLPKNRKSTLSLHLSVIAVADTIVLVLGETKKQFIASCLEILLFLSTECCPSTLWFVFVFLSGITVYLATVHNVQIPPGPYWFCAIGNFALFGAVQCSSLSIVSMTSERFYSMLKPHKAASFNTMKKAKMRLASVLIFSLGINCPHLFIGSNNGWQCVPYGKVIGRWHGDLYYWISFCLSFILPFILLMSMNSYIIHIILRRRSFSMGHTSDQNQLNGQQTHAAMNSAEKQAVVTLLLVSFAFLILTTPTYMLFLCILFVDFSSTPFKVAQFHIFYQFAQKLYYTNHGINFVFYVLAGSRFRSDLLTIMTCGMKTDRDRDRGTSDTTQMSEISGSVAK